MAYEQKNNSGSLFKNDKMTSDKSPPYKGSVMIDGVEYWQSAWVKETKDGKKWFSQSFTRKEQSLEPRREEPQRNTSNDIDDSIPF
jgi:hypothetical protein